MAPFYSPHTLLCQVYRQPPVGLLGLAPFGNDLPDLSPQNEVESDLKIFSKSMQTFSKLFNTTLYVCGYWTGFKYLINLFNTIQYHISDCISRVWLGHRFIRNPSWDLQAWRPLGFNGIFFEETESSQRVFGARLGFNLVSDPAFEPICNCQPNRNGPFHFWGPDSKSHFLVFDICAAAVITDNRANCETLPKAQQTQGLITSTTQNAFESYHKWIKIQF